MCFDIE